MRLAKFVISELQPRDGIRKQSQLSSERPSSSAKTTSPILLYEFANTSLKTDLNEDVIKSLLGLVMTAQSLRYSNSKIGIQVLYALT